MSSKTKERNRNGQDQSPLELSRLTVSLGVILAFLVGSFSSQLRQLFDEISREPNVLHPASLLNDFAETSADSGSSDARGVAGIQFSCELEPGGQDTDNQEPLLLEKIALVENFVRRNEPFVCRRCMAAQSLTGWWDSDSNILDAVGKDTEMPIRVAGSNQLDDTIADNENHNGKQSTQFQRIAAPGRIGKSVSAYQEKIMSASEFFKGYKAHSGQASNNEHWYAAQVDIATTISGLLKYALASSPAKSLLEAIGPTLPISRHPMTLYFGAGKRTTQLHYDSFENVVCLASGGSKTFDLFDPAQSSKFLYADRTKYGNGSPVMPSLDQADLMMAKYALASRVSLRTGDCLYLPVYWYHSVTSSKERSISINYWRSPDPSKMRMLENVFCGRDDFRAGAKCSDA